MSTKKGTLSASPSATSHLGKQESSVVISATPSRISASPRSKSKAAVVPPRAPSPARLPTIVLTETELIVQGLVNDVVLRCTNYGMRVEISLAECRFAATAAVAALSKIADLNEAARVTNWRAGKVLFTEFNKPKTLPWPAVDQKVD